MAQALTANRQRRYGRELQAARAAWLLAADLAARAVGADVRIVLQTSGERGRRNNNTIALARKIACYLAVVTGNNIVARVSEAAGIDRKTIFAHLQWVEDEREQAKFDQTITDLESAMIRMAVQVIMANLGEVAA